MARKVTKKDGATFFVNSLGVVSYIFILLAYTLPLTVFAGMIMVLTRSDSIVVPVEVQQSAQLSLDATSQLQAVAATSAALLVVVAVIGIIAWVILKVPSALFGFGSRIVHAAARQLRAQPTIWTVWYAKLFVAIIPAALMMMLYVFLWEYTVMVPLLALTGILAVVGILFALVQTIGARLLTIVPTKIF